MKSKTSEVGTDTLREQVMVVVLDTVKEITTVTVVLRQVQEPTDPERSLGLSKGRGASTSSATAHDDTLRITTVTDRTRASTRDRYHDVQEKVLIKTDTVYVEKQSDKQTVVAADPNVEIDKEGNVTRKVNRLSQTLKWVFFAALAIAVLLIVLKFYRR